MKVATIKHGESIGIAADAGEGYRFILSDSADFPGLLQNLLRSGADLEEVAKHVLATGHSADDIVYLPPVGAPGKIICVGLNYVDHANELGLEIPEYPTIFIRLASSLIGSGQAIQMPEVSRQLDFEAELAVVIGRSGYQIPEEVALDYVAGYTCFNDVTLRDFQFKTTQWTMGKNFDGTGAFGPALTLASALPPGAKGLKITGRLNGKIVQESSTASLIFDVPNLIAILSQVMTLEAGDVIITGTPAGVGVSRKPPLFMKQGDTFEVEIDQIGLLRNQIE